MMVAILQFKASKLNFIIYIVPFTVVIFTIMNSPYIAENSDR